MKTKKIVLFLLSVIYCFSNFLTPIYATTTEQTSLVEKIVEVYDNASVLTDKEKISLKKYAEKYSEKTNINVFFVTTDNTEEKSIEDYTKAFYDEKTKNQIENSGIVFLVDTNKKSTHIYRTGNAYIWLNKPETTRAINDGLKYLEKEEYKKCLKEMASYALPAIEHWCKKGDTEDDNMHKYLDEKNIYKPKINIFKALINFVKNIGIGIIGVIGLFVFFVLAVIWSITPYSTRHSLRRFLRIIRRN